MRNLRNDTNMLMKNISKEPGIYLGGAKKSIMQNHMFVLLVRENNIYIFDEALGLTTNYYQKETYIGERMEAYPER